MEIEESRRSGIRATRGTKEQSPLRIVLRDEETARKRCIELERSTRVSFAIDRFRETPVAWNYHDNGNDDHEKLQVNTRQNDNEKGTVLYWGVSRGGANARSMVRQQLVDVSFLNFTWKVSAPRPATTPAPTPIGVPARLFYSNMRTNAPPCFVISKSRSLFESQGSVSGLIAKLLTGVRFLEKIKRQSATSRRMHVRLNNRFAISMMPHAFAIFKANVPRPPRDFSGLELAREPAEEKDISVVRDRNGKNRMSAWAPKPSTFESRSSYRNKELTVNHKANVLNVYVKPTKGFRC
ncbi:hypothetical protein WN48_01589 [Eufriesea mexicana]|nr:hypothetical protein WN48_01589 [Eufriesea mexicana]